MDDELADGDRAASLSIRSRPASLLHLVREAQSREVWIRSKRRKRDGSVASTSKAARRQQQRASAASFYVPRLPAQPADLQLAPMYSGHLPASYAIRDDVNLDILDNDAHLFFLLVKAKHVADKAKLVIWFNGGRV